MRRAVVGSVATLVVAFVGIGALHTPAGRPVLRWMAGGSCPVGEEMDPLAVDVVRRETLAAELGGDPAGDRTVDGLALGVADPFDVPAWATNRELACVGGPPEITCTGPSEDVRLGFDPTGRLVSMVVATTLHDPADAAAAFEVRARDFDIRVGPAVTTRGDASGPFLDRGPLQQASHAYRFSDYRIDLTATNLGHDRFVVREAHQVL